jgi:flagellin
LNVIQESRESEYTVTVYDAHTNKLVTPSRKISGNVLHGDVTENIDVRFDPLANTDVTWNEAMKRYDLTQSSEVFVTTVHLSDNSTVLQIGANERERMNVDFGDVSASALGLDGVLVISRETAQKAITRLDRAIGIVSAQRARLGAYQNRLEHTAANLTAASTNLTGAESRIRDADMAQEMLNFTRLQILLQNGTAMLGQANQMPQNVLSLLRG